VTKFSIHLTEALQPLESNDVFESDIERALEKDIRTPELEPIIMKNPRMAGQYAKYVIKGRWPEAEPIIMQDPGHAYLYAKYIIKDRWPEAEPYIITIRPGGRYLLTKYAGDVIKGRWPEAEPYIMKDPEQAFYYARDVIKGRWPEAEPYIMKDPYWQGKYKRTFFGQLTEALRARRPPLEAEDQWIPEPEPGSVVTHAYKEEDIIPALLDELRKYDPIQVDRLETQIPEEPDAEWWESEEAQWLIEDLYNDLDEYAPPGYWFGGHPDDPADIGYWPAEED